METQTSAEKQTRDDEAGFSLVELMVVVLIMSILAGVIALNVLPAGDKARLTKAQADVASIESALEQYSLDMFTLPSAQNGLEALRTAPSDVDASAYRPNGYIKRLRNDPWNNPYQYVVPGQRSGAAYDLFSMGPDRRPNTDDDIGNWGEF